MINPNKKPYSILYWVGLPKPIRNFPAYINGEKKEDIVTIPITVSFEGKKEREKTMITATKTITFKPGIIPVNPDFLVHKKISFRCPECEEKIEMAPPPHYCGNQRVVVQTMESGGIFVRCDKCLEFEPIEPDKIRCPNCNS